MRNMKEQKATNVTWHIHRVKREKRDHPHYICELQGEIEDVHDIQSFYTGNSHELIREYILNAKKHFDKEKPPNERVEPTIHIVVKTNNISKEKILTQVQTVQYISFRIIAALAASL